jgi:hypothetical protein
VARAGRGPPSRRVGCHSPTREIVFRSVLARIIKSTPCITSINPIISSPSPPNPTARRCYPTCGSIGLSRIPISPISSLLELSQSLLLGSELAAIQGAAAERAVGSGGRSAVRRGRRGLPTVALPKRLLLRHHLPIRPSSTGKFLQCLLASGLPIEWRVPPPLSCASPTFTTVNAHGGIAPLAPTPILSSTVGCRLQAGRGCA